VRLGLVPPAFGVITGYAIDSYPGYQLYGGIIEMEFTPQGEGAIV